uniref:Uncharacterized protein n=1 Tax=Opuntia streptacantha TaxID=393608 RepID=A0A7C9FJ28_OPUST
MTSAMPTYASPIANYLHTEDCQGSHAQDGAPDSESNVSAFPPRFTSLVSNCYAFPSENPKLAKSPLQMKSLQNQGSRKLEHMRFSIEGRFHHSPRGIQIHCRPTKWEVGASEVLTRMHISSFSQRNSQALQTLKF